MLLSLALVLIAIAGGTLATYLYDVESPLAARLCAGACVGLALFGLVGFVFASLLGLGSLALALTALVMALPLVGFRDPQLRELVRRDVLETKEGVRQFVRLPTPVSIVYLLFYAAAALLLWLAFDRVMFEHADGIYTGVLNNFGDLPFHLSVVTSFVYGGNFPPEDPTYLGARFTYPFIVDFVVAALVRAGASIRQALLMENFVLGLAFVGLLHRWALEFLRDRLAALLTPLLVLMSGGIGWLLLLRDVRQGEEGILRVLWHPTHAYTVLPEPLEWWGAFRWGNAVTSLLLPQRSFLLGLPLALIVFMQWWKAIEGERQKAKGEDGKREKGKSGRGREAKGKSKKSEDEKRAIEGGAQERVEASSTAPFHPFTLAPFSSSARRMLAAGAVAGLLPLVHAHTFVVVMGMGACLALLFREWRAWAIFFIFATLIAAPQLWWSTQGSSVKAASFFGWQMGWDRVTKGVPENIFWFWFKNTGLFIPLTVAAILWRDGKYLVSRRRLLFFLPFTLCFLIPNVVRLAPWIWDNIKVLFYWYLASAPLIALLLAHLWRGGLAPVIERVMRALVGPSGTMRRMSGKRPLELSRVLAVLLFVSLTLAGALDVWGIVSRASEYGEFDRDGVRFAEMIKSQTEPRAVILHAPIHNHPVFLTGRRSVMGYPGHIWTHGLDYANRESEIKRIYAGGPDAENLMSRYGVQYVVVGPLEKLVATVNEAFFNRYPKVGEVGEYRLYKITRR